MDKKIISVEKNSIAEEMGIEPGDILVSVNGNHIEDIFDYRYHISSDYIELLVEKKSGDEWLLEIDKEENEDLGLVFGSGLMDEAKSCKNKCVFCFIDQLPKKVMRETLYFKDDDNRLSFLQGSYITLTNLKPEDLDRITYYHLSPINISVHTTDPKLREFMLKNKNAGLIMEQIKKLSEAGISLNFQIVLCKGINDGENLDRSIGDLAGFLPKAKSLSVVPVGLTKYREENSLFELAPFEPYEALKVIEQVEVWQKKLKKIFGTRFVFASDEFYLKANKKIPLYSHYEDFPQLENGVGMLAVFEEEFEKNLKKIDVTSSSRNVTIVTGEAAFDFIEAKAKKLMEKINGLKIKVLCVPNDFFGGGVDVSGLLTGKDILNILLINKKELGEEILIPENSLRAGENVFLDDLKTTDLEKETGVKVTPVGIDGREFVKKILLI